MTRVLLLLMMIGCGSGSDEIEIVCTNTGTGDQVCGAAGGATIDRNQPPPPTPRD